MKKAGKNIYIFSPFHCPSPEGIEIANNVNISQNCHISGEGGVKIGSFVLIGPNTIILSSNHGFNKINIPMVRQKLKCAPVTIADDVWIGANVVILPGTNIKQGAIVGAGSIVTKNVPAYAVMAGNPAKIVKKRCSQTKIKRLLSPKSLLYKYCKNDYLATSEPTLYFKKQS